MSEQAPLSEPASNVSADVAAGVSAHVANEGGGFRWLLLGCAALVGALLPHEAETQFWLIAGALVVVLCPARFLLQAQRTALLCAFAVVLLVAGIKDDAADLLQGEVRVWNVYHYYIGAKYFPELGYSDLYRATLVADREATNYWTEDVEKIRSLTEYSVAKLTAADLAYDPAVHFTPKRWEQFKHDVASLQPHMSARSWRNVFRDRGYNGTPAWTAIGRGLAWVFPATSPGLLLLVGIDLAALLATLWFAYRTFGAHKVVLVLLLFAASPANVARLVGGFLQTDWLCALVVSLCFLQRGRRTLAGVFMGYALMTRVFPVLMIVAAAGAVLWQWWRSRSQVGSDQATARPTPLMQLSRFYLAIALTACLLFVLGSLGNGRGLQGWSEFKSAIGLHKEIHVLGDRRVGLQHFFTQELDDLSLAVEDDRRAELLEKNRPLFWVAATLLLGLLTVACTRRTEFEGLLLGIVAVFALLVLSRYYFGTLALLPLLAVSKPTGRYLVVGGQLAVFLVYTASLLNGFDFHAAYALLNGLLGVYFAVVLVALIGLRRPGLQA